MAQPAFLTTRTPSRRKYYILLSTLLLILLLLLADHHASSLHTTISSLRTSLSTSLAVHSTSLTKPEGLKVIALVFFGRIDRISILDCYLRRNLVVNGGWLDEVIFVVNAHDTYRMEWLDRTVAKTPGYTKWGGCEDCGWERAWRISQEVPGGEEAMWIKIDDDIVFIEPTTIPSIVSTLYANPSYLAVTANIINQPRMSWIHAHYGAIHSYLPEPLPPSPSTSDSVNLTSWRASELPLWTAPEGHSDSDSETAFAIDYTKPFNAPFEGHRWLPLPDSSDPYKTPIASTTYDASGPGWFNWAVAAQQHASFFQNLERGELWRYHHSSAPPASAPAVEKGASGGDWKFWAEQFSIQLVAVRGTTLVEHPLSNEDEKDLSVWLPQKLGRHCVMAAGGVAVHYAHGAQYGSGLEGGHGIEWTNFLEMYRSYALENVCGV